MHNDARNLGAPSQAPTGQDQSTGRDPSQPQASVQDMIRQINQESSLKAQKWYAEKRKIGIGMVLVSMVQRFFKVYFFRGGIWRGFNGFRDAAHSALFQLFTYAKYWELKEREKGRM